MNITGIIERKSRELSNIFNKMTYILQYYCQYIYGVFKYINMTSNIRSMNIDQQMTTIHFEKAYRDFLPGRLG